MSMRFSTSLRNKMLGLTRAAVHAHRVANTISFTAVPPQILDSGNGLITAGFKVGDVVYAKNTISNNTQHTITSLAAGVAAVTPAPVVEAAGTVFSLAAASGGSLRDVMRNGKLMIYSGVQPATADAAATGTLLGEFTLDGGAWVAGEPGNGINLGVPAAGVIAKEGTETWKMTGLANGTAGYFRFVANPADNGALSTVLDRIDGSIGTTTGSDMQLVSTAITLGYIYYINNAIFTFPYQYGA